MRAAVARGVSDPLALARLSQLFLDSIGGPIVSTAEEAQQDRAAPRVRPPAVDGGVLVYWHWTGGMAHYVQRSRVSLTTFEREVKSVDELEAEEDPIGVARRRLASGGDTYSIDFLVERCSVAGAAALLDETLRSHPRANIRAHAAWSMRKCSDADSVPALIDALDKETESEVRWKAADTLGELRAQAAREALQRAAESSNPDVKYAAQRALDKLK